MESVATTTNGTLMHYTTAALSDTVQDDWFYGDEWVWSSRDRVWVPWQPTLTPMTATTMTPWLHDDPPPIDAPTPQPCQAIPKGEGLSALRSMYRYHISLFYCQIGKQIISKLAELNAHRTQGHCTWRKDDIVGGRLTEITLGKRPCSMQLYEGCAWKIKPRVPRGI